MKDGLRDIAADVEKFGWTVMRVTADNVRENFAYSIGMVLSFGHPEILIAGLRHDTAHRIINDVGEAVRAGKRYSAGAITDEFLEGYSVTFRTVPRHQFGAYLGWGLRYYDDQPFTVLQLIYPDSEHRWPWQDGVSEEFRQVQPVLADQSEPPWARDPAV